MLKVEGTEVIVDRETTRLVGYRLEDTIRAPAIIVFVDEDKPQLLPIRQGDPPPTRIRSHNMEAEIQIISYQEINTFLGRP
ncbi:hypothetical protein [Desulfobulbus elongatus]|uniref:hypothetical protein n=1 Tax=Desulfobulbus elongatus TaxID=53332 RepID=UPI0012FA71B6|nr:hypothetical protein [Desulfobulbus elongatus]